MMDLWRAGMIEIFVRNLALGWLLYLISLSIG